MAQCPAHNDRRASLSVTDGNNGGAVLFCHAGCPTETVVAVLGLSLLDLAPDRPNGGQVFGDHKAARRSLESRLGPVAAYWDYHDRNGEPVGYVLRWGTPHGAAGSNFARQ